MAKKSKEKKLEGAEPVEQGFNFHIKTIATNGNEKIITLNINGADIRVEGTFFSIVIGVYSLILSVLDGSVNVKVTKDGVVVLDEQH